MRGVARFLLIFVCLAFRFPEAIPLSFITAKVVAEGLVQIFARTGLPLTLRLNILLGGWPKLNIGLINMTSPPTK